MPAPDETHFDGSEPEAGRPDLERIGRFRLLRQVGWGGMGIVYEAIDEDSGERLALKILRFTDPTGNALRRFQQESAAALRLHHPHIVAVHEVSRADGYDFYTMDYVVGVELDEWLRHTQPSLRGTLGVLVQVVRAVEHAHSRGILHRDLKPANIIVAADGHAWVTDFGLARTIGADSSITGSGQTVGTPGYMSPEQARGLHKECGPESDVWSLGVILYEACTGRLPFEADNALDILHAVVNHDPPPPSRVTTGVSPRLERVIMQCLEKRPSDRYPSAGELAEDLDRYLQGSSVRARSRSGWRSLRRWRWRHRGVPILLGAIVLALAANALWLGRRDRQPPPLDTTAPVHRVPTVEWAILTEWSAGLERPPAEALRHADHTLQADTAISRSEAGAIALEPGQWILARDVEVTGDVRLTVEVEWQGELDGVELLINGRSTTKIEYPGACPIGYLAQVAGYEGAIDFISPNRREQLLDYSGASSSLVTEPERRYRLTFERVGDRLSLCVDDEVTATMIDPLPLVGDRLTSIGLRSWAEGTLLHSFRVERALGSHGPPPLVALDALLRNGRIDAAYREASDLAEFSRDPTIRDRARLRQASIILADPARPDLGAVAILRDIVHDGVEEEVVSWARELLASALWGSGHYLEALDLGEELVEQSRASRVVRRILRDHPDSLPQDPQLRRRSLTFIASDQRLGALRLRDCGIESIAAFAHSDLRLLELPDNRIEDLSPVRELPLRRLIIPRNRIRSVAALGGTPLRQLNLDGNPVADLRPLAGLALESLSVDGTLVRDLAGLENAAMRRLSASDTPLVDVSVLVGATITELDLSGSDLVDGSHLGQVKVGALTISRTAIDDLGSVLQPDLRRLTADETPITALPSFERTPKLVVLSIAGTAVSDLEVLAEHRLLILNIERTRIADLAPLDASQLHELNCSHTPLRTLGRALGGELRRITAFGSAVPVDEFAALPVTTKLRIGPSSQRPWSRAEIDRLMAAWSDRPQRQAQVQLLRALRAVQDRDPAAMLAAARRQGDLLVLRIPVSVQRDEAARLSEGLPGWRLPTRMDARHLRDHGGTYDVYWYAPEVGDAAVFYMVFAEFHEGSEITHDSWNQVMLVRDADPPVAP